MYPYFISILFFFFINYFISTILKKYTFEKFFIYVLVYFFIVGFYNLIYLKNINFFTIQTFFSVFIFSPILYGEKETGFSFALIANKQFSLNRKKRLESCEDLKLIHLLK